MAINIIALVIAVGIPQGMETPKVPDVRCGGYCLYIAAGVWGKCPDNYIKFEESIGPPSSSGYSMSQLADFAKKSGLFVTPVQTSVDRLMTRKEQFACIVLLKKSHFVLLKQIANEKAFLIDPPNEFHVPITTFKAEWDGRALLLGPQPFQSEEELAISTRNARMLRWSFAAFVLVVVLVVAYYFRRNRLLRSATIVAYAVGVVSQMCGCDRVSDIRAVGAPKSANAPVLYVEKQANDLGTVNKLTHVDALIVKSVIRNRGSSPLKIKNIQQSCSCTAVSLAERVVKGGHSTELIARIQLGDVTGPRSSSLVIESNDPIQPVQSIHYSWRVATPLRTLPDNIAIKDIAPGETTQVTISVVMDPVMKCDERFEMRQIGGSSMIQCVPVDEESAAKENIGATTSATGQNVLGNYLITVRGGAEEGIFAEQLSFVLLCNKMEKARLVLPLHWNVHAGVKISPNRMFLGFQKPSSVALAALIIRATEEHCKVLDIVLKGEVSLDNVAFEERTSNVHHVKLEVRMPDRVGPVRATAIVRVQYGNSKVMTLTVPFSAVVQ